MPNEEIHFPADLFAAIDEVHTEASREYLAIDSNAKALAHKRNEKNQQITNDKSTSGTMKPKM